MTFDTSVLTWLIIIIIWDLIWKGIAMWKAGRNNQKKWFIVLLVLNTVGILPILYISFFQKKPVNNITDTPV